MSEYYPDDAALLALTEDAETGVEYIPTGLSPYYLEFRKLVSRLLDATRRANDLRVYQDGDLTIGVRAGRCAIASTPISYAGATGVSITDDATTHVWLDASGALQSGESGLPTDRATFVPLAQVVAASGAITSITDLRGEALLCVPPVGAVAVQMTHEGDLTASLTGKLVGVSPIDGVVTDVILSAGTNLDTDTTSDGVSATAKANGTTLTSTDPQLTDGDGAGFRCTAQGDGAAAVVKSDGSEQVTRGDVLTVDVSRSVVGAVANEASDVVVTIVIEPA
ncbi:MAG: hypothetical protein GC159_14395 [Phycisphaera sp.]|nr:hypothetical protein [Phycisphaera sp.]